MFITRSLARTLALGLVTLTVLGSVPSAVFASHVEDDPWHRSSSTAHAASALLAANTAGGKTETAPSGISAEWSFTDDGTELYYTITFPFDPPPASFRVYYQKPGENAFTRVTEFTPLPTSCDTQMTVSAWTLHKRCTDSRWEINSPHLAPTAYTDGEYRFYLSSINGSGREHPSQEFSLKYPTAPKSEHVAQTSTESVQTQLDTAKVKLNDLVQQIQKRTATPSAPTVTPTPSSVATAAPVPTQTGASIANIPTISRILARGTSGDDVKQLQIYLAKDKDVYPEGVATGYFGALTEAAVKRFQEKHGIEPAGIVGPKTRAKFDELAAGGVPEKAAGRGHLTDVVVGKTAKRGDSGDHVKKTQEFLAMFPEIYPNGLATGFYGEQTEKAVKKFQEKVGRAQTGEVDNGTKDVLDRLLVAGEKKKPPKITDVTPASGAAGITVTLTGRGFTSENNAIMMRGKIVASALVSYDNNTQIDFILTSDAPCTPGGKKPCPIKVVNANGISNAKPFKLEAFLLTPPEINPETPPEPEPVPLPEPPPPPPPPSDTGAPLRSNGLPTGEFAYGTKTATLSITTDENATCKYATAANTSYASMPLQFGMTGSTTHATNLTGLEDGKTYNYYARCQDTAGNANTDDYTISFSIATPPKPVITSLSPTKGVIGTKVTVNGSGFTATGNTVSFAGMDAATNVASLDEKTLALSVPSGTSCSIGQTCAVTVRNVNGTSNESGFLLTQNVSPVTVVFPNGGENLVQGVDFTLSWTGGTDRVDVILVEEAATASADPGEFIVGWVARAQNPGSTVTWNVKTVCSADGAVCTDIAPGRYKLLALSENEIGALTVWDDFTNLPGNWDLSNSAFTVSPAATLTVVVPNGREIGSQNSAFIICWATIDLKSQVVRIELLKNGAVYRTMYPGYRQAIPNGAYITAWTIPGDIPEGADYQVKISDASIPQVFDMSDGMFSITAASSAIKIYQPNGSSWSGGGEIWYAGFDGPVQWYGTNILSKTVNINLWKNGFFYRSLGVNVPQAYSTGGAAYTTGWFYQKVKIPADVPTGADYAVEIVDALNPAIRDFSDYNFTIVQYPSYLTVNGRLVDHLNKTPVANTYIQNYDGSYWHNARPNTNGDFTLIATTSDILLARGHSFWAYPTNYDYRYWRILSNPLGLYAYVYNFPFIGPSRTFPITSGEVNLGEISFWPFVDQAYIVSDIPTRANINYRSAETGQSSYNIWNYYNFSNSQYLWKAIPQGLDVWARIEDKPGNVSYSPMLALPATPAVPSQTLSFFNQNAQWEPYAINAYAWYYPTLLKVGTPLSYGNAYAYAGVAPFTWSVLSGQLPPGIMLSSTGAISGTPSTAGVYDAVLLVTDANKVHGVVQRLRFDIRSETGTQVPTIKVTSPQARQELYPNGTAYLYWDSFGITSKAVVIDLYKGGSFVNKIAGFSQGAEGGNFNYYWRVPTDLAGGTDYSIRISDVNNAAVYGESDLFVIASRTTSFSWNSWKGSYMPYFWFQYATSTNPTATTYKLYRQKTGDAMPSVIATFGTPLCGRSIPSDPWYLSVWCYPGSSGYNTPSWSVQYNRYASSSVFAPGDYTYELKAVDGAGVESSITRGKTRIFTMLNITSPMNSDSPLSTPTPTFRWSIPTDWPSTIEKPYQISIWDVTTGAHVYYMYGLTAPTDTEGSRRYDGPALDPAKKYSAMVTYQRSVLDTTTASYAGQISMNATPVTFSVGQ